MELIFILAFVAIIAYGIYIFVMLAKLMRARDNLRKEYYNHLRNSAKEKI